ncbi:MAG: alpha/beta fold hydrolase [Anaerolineae bacterium]|nr:alpha/beta fold hydrolase [Anaerolineae bacterium]
MNKWKGDLVFVFIIVVAVVGWVRLYPDFETSSLSPLEPPIEFDAEPRTVASSSGERLAYRLIEPPGEAEVVLVFLHDTLLHSGWYIELGYDLASRGVAVYLPDRRGWGYSSGDSCQADQDQTVLIDDIMAMIVAARARYPQNKIFIGAHGRGAGLVVSYVASRRPVDGVVLVAPYISPDQPNLDLDGWRSFMVAHPGEAFLAQSGLSDWAVWHLKWPPSMVHADPLIQTRLSISCMQETIPQDVEAACRALSVPLLYVQGEADTLFDPEQAAAFMAQFSSVDKKTELVPGADYLGILSVAAEPIAEWMNAR